MVLATRGIPEVTAWPGTRARPATEAWLETVGAEETSPSTPAITRELVDQPEIPDHPVVVPPGVLVTAVEPLEPGEPQGVEEMPGAAVLEMVEPGAIGKERAAGVAVGLQRMEEPATLETRARPVA